MAATRRVANKNVEMVPRQIATVHLRRGENCDLSPRAAVSTPKTR